VGGRPDRDQRVGEDWTSPHADRAGPGRARELPLGPGQWRAVGHVEGHSIRPRHGSGGRPPVARSTSRRPQARAPPSAAGGRAPSAAVDPAAVVATGPASLPQFAGGRITLSITWITPLLA